MRRRCLTMARKVLNVSVPDDLWSFMEEDLGRTPFSAHVAHILRLLYDPEMGLSKDIESFRAGEGLRQVPDAMERLLRDALDAHSKRKRSR